MRLGASVTMAADRPPRRSSPSIAPAARAVGGPAVRNMATVGGNLFAPTPYGDFAVALLALDATVDVDGKTIDLDEFLMLRDEIDGIVSSRDAFACPPRAAFRFAKVSRVKPKGVSVLSIAALLETDAAGTVTAARIALGCMADRPIRAKAAEEALIGGQLTEEGIAPAVAAVARRRRSRRPTRSPAPGTGARCCRCISAGCCCS